MLQHCRVRAVGPPEGWFYTPFTIESTNSRKSERFATVATTHNPAITVRQPLPTRHNAILFMRSALLPCSGRIHLVLLVLFWSFAAAASTGDALHTQAAGELTADPQQAAPARSAQITPWLEAEVRQGDSLSAIFSRNGLAASQWHELLAIGTDVAPLRHLQPGEILRLRKTPDGRLAALHFAVDSTHILTVRRDGEVLHARLRQRDVTTRRVTANGTIDTSLAAALQAAGAPEQTAAQLERIFARADLTHGLHAGDEFTVIYKADYIDEQRVHTGPVLAASIRTHGRILRAFRHLDADGHVHYYDARGRSHQPGIQRTPVHNSHVSSPFDLHRRHPTLGGIHPHKGVDLSAPRGEAVMAAADGIVTFKGWRTGYGRLIKIEHAGGYTTRYAHLADFAPDLVRGEHVTQGQTIGYVGSSGHATGTHLHFEIRKDGVPHNPMTMDLPDGRSLSGSALTAFSNRIQPLLLALHDNDGTSPILQAATANTEQGFHCARPSVLGTLLAHADSPIDTLVLDQVFCPAGS